MSQDANIHREQLIIRLTTILEVKYIYCLDFGFQDYRKYLLIVILERNCSSLLANELSSMVAKIFQNETDFLYRIFSLEYAQQQLKGENLFFVHGCTWDKIIFQNSDAELDSFYECHIPEKTLSIIQSIFEKEFSALKHYPFKKGLYTAGIVTEGYLDVSFMISNLLKVCIIAMEADYCSTRSIPEPEHNIREVLRYVLDLIPHNEMEVLDAFRELAVTS
ncbi:hypothetical protein MWU65_17260 [Cellulophaga sp. F20128]|uniref:hypothetical protein n=1 Tax=Cellulophaga sp. F20128 TaxID=2926413 RepID=UPI001FF6FAC8|nr:hypothetical protein [Cellulophaga sp. F20128]MCK0158939.1 hypothetical protein [Cellulophaga sp. F20128]